jgi:hypothetical protein
MSQLQHNRQVQTDHPTKASQVFTGNHQHELLR